MSKDKYPNGVNQLGEGPGEMPVVNNLSSSSEVTDHLKVTTEQTGKQVNLVLPKIEEMHPSNYETIEPSKVTAVHPLALGNVATKVKGLFKELHNDEEGSIKIPNWLIQNTPDGVKNTLVKTQKGGKWIWERGKWVWEKGAKPPLNLAGEGMHKYRKTRENPYWGKVEGGARAAGGGFIAYETANQAANYFVDAIARGDLLMRFGAVPGVGVLALGGMLGVRKINDLRNYYWKVKGAFDAHASGARLATEGSDKDTLTNMRNFIKDNLHVPASKLLVEDGDDEQDLLVALHKLGVARPFDVPYMGSDASYAEYCFDKFSEICKKAHDGEKLSGLSNDQYQTLADSHLAAITDDVAKSKARKSLLEMSLVYGRLICDYHRDKREGQVTGAIIGSTYSTFGLSGGMSLPIGAGALYLRKKYRESRSKLSHIEITPEGKLDGKLTADGTHRLPILNVTTEAHYGHEFFDAGEFVTFEDVKFEGLSDTAKKWFPRINIPDGLHGDTAEELGHHAAPFVFDSLLKLKGFKTPAKPEVIAPKKEEYADARAVLKELTDRLKGLPTDIDAATLALINSKKEAEANQHGKKSSGRYSGAIAKYEGELKVLESRHQKQEERVRAKEVEVEAISVTGSKAKLRKELADLRAQQMQQSLRVQTQTDVVKALQAQGDPADEALKLLAAYEEKALRIAERILGKQKEIAESGDPDFIEATRELNQLNAQLDSIYENILKVRSELERLGESKESDEVSTDRMKKVNDEDIEIKQQKLNRLLALKNKLEGDGTDKDKGEVAKQTERVEELRVKLHELEVGVEPVLLTPPAIVDNADIRAAFYVKVHQKFKAMHEKHAPAGFMAGMYEGGKTWMKNKAKELGDNVASSAIGGTIAGSAVGLGLGYFSALDPIKWGIIAGGIGAIGMFIKRMGWVRGGGHVAPSHAEKPAEKPHH